MVLLIGYNILGVAALSSIMGILPKDFVAPLNSRSAERVKENRIAVKNGLTHKQELYIKLVGKY